jgi:hypothetical protein
MVDRSIKESRESHYALYYTFHCIQHVVKRLKVLGVYSIRRDGSKN